MSRSTLFDGFYSGCLHVFFKYVMFSSSRPRDLSLHFQIIIFASWRVLGAYCTYMNGFYTQYKHSVYDRLDLNVTFHGLTMKKITKSWIDEKELQSDYKNVLDVKVTMNNVINLMTNRAWRYIFFVSGHLVYILYFLVFLSYRLVLRKNSDINGTFSHLWTYRQ